MPKTGIICITNTLQCIPKSSAFPKTTTKDYLQQAIRNILVFIQEPLNTIPFLSYGDATKHFINQIENILQINTTQPRLPAFPLSPILPAIPIPTPLLPTITRPDTPAPRLVPVVKYPMVQPYQPVPTVT